MAWVFVQVFSACSFNTTQDHGTLIVRAKTSGTVVIFPTADESLFKRLKREHYPVNQPLHLKPGEYTVQLNCSMRRVIINADQTLTLLSHYFIIDTLGHFDAKRDRLRAFCTLPQLKYKAALAVNKPLNVFPGAYTLSINQEERHVQIETNGPVPRLLLNYVLVEAAPKIRPRLMQEFYLYPSNKSSGVIHQSLGAKIFTLPGDYIIELNGTKRRVTLDSKEPIKIASGQLLIRRPRKGINQQKLFPLLDGTNILDYNHAYLLIPGSYTLNLNKEDIQKKITIHPNTKLEVTTAIITVQSHHHCKTEKKYQCFEENSFFLYDLKKQLRIGSIPLNQQMVVFPGSYGLGIGTSHGVMKPFEIEENAVTSVRTGLLRISLRKKPDYIRGFVRIEGIKEIKEKSTEIPRVVKPISSIIGESSESRIKQEKYYELIPGNYQFRLFFRLPNSREIQSKVITFTIYANKITRIFT